ncbi:MAG: hypothetical protein PF572_02655 [Patescibacteria group bacterium]|jgi:hypothetical protein|nr:hypothetical protein [Patescibacteria group bacterium]
MIKTIHYSEVLRKRESKETKDKIEVIEGKKYSLYFLYDGTEEGVNTNRAISAASKFIKNNYSYYQDKDLYKLKNLIIDANQKILELNLSNATTGVVVLYVSKEDEGKSFFIILGKSAVYTTSHDQLVRINTKKNEKLLGHNRLSKDDIPEVYIKNNKAPLFVCSDGFINLLVDKRKDVIKILNQKDIGSSRASMNRIMKARNFDDLAYLFIKKIF